MIKYVPLILLVLTVRARRSFRQYDEGVDPDMRDDLDDLGESDSIDSGGDQCVVKQAPKSRVLPQMPSVRLVSSNREQSEEQVNRNQLQQQSCGVRTRELAPRLSEKIETFTETYTVTQIKHRVYTRKRKFRQRRKLIKQKFNKPVLVVKKRLIKERQVYERIIPKVVETRQIINNPSETSKIVEGPVEEIETTPPMDPCGDIIITTACPPGFESGDDDLVDPVVPPMIPPVELPVGRINDRSFGANSYSPQNRQFNSGSYYAPPVNPPPINPNYRYYG